WTTWFGRVAFFAGPVIAYVVTKRICLGLQRKDRALLEHGVETGIIRQLPGGTFVEETRPVDAETYAVLTSRTGVPAITGAPAEEISAVPAPEARGAKGWIRARLYHAFHEEIPATDGDAHRAGTGEDGDREIPAHEERPSGPPNRALWQPARGGRSGMLTLDHVNVLSSAVASS